MLKLIESIVTMNSQFVRGLKIPEKINLFLVKICFIVFLFFTVLLSSVMGTTLSGVSLDSGYDNYQEQQLGVNKFRRCL